MSVITAAPPVSRARQLAAATVGNIVEWFDWYVYSMLALYFSAQFFPKTGDPIVPLLSAMAIFAVGFFMRPLGGFLGGIVADRFGRKKALTATVMLMGVGSLLVAIAPTYDQVGVLSPMILVLARLLQGLSTGGEFAASSTFLVESAPDGRRGFFSSFLYIGATLGNLAAIGSVALLVAGLPDEAMREWGWRVPFAIGTLGAAAGLFIRRFAEETLVTGDDDPGSGPGAARAPKPSVFEFMRTHPKECALVFAINAAPTLFFYVFTSYLPTYAHITVGFDMKNGLLVALISLSYFAILQPVMGILSDRIGRKPLLLTFGLGFTLLTLPLLNSLQNSFLSLLLVQMAALTLLACYTSITSAVMCELFPARIRAAGIGLPYALGVALVGGTGPYVATWLADAQMIDVFGWYLTILAAITTAVFLRLKESYKTGRPAVSVIGFFDRGWRSNPDGVAYVQGATSYTFSEAGELSCRIANALLASGLSSGAKVAVLAPNDPLAWICVLGIWRSGLTWIPANPASPSGETAQLLEAFDAEMVIFHSSLAGDARHLRDRLPAVRRWVQFGPGDAGPGDTPFAEWTAPHPATKPDVRSSPDDVVSLAPTGGTTGLPKGVMNTNRSLSAFATHLMMAAHYGSEDAIVNLAAAPMTHTAGLLSLAATARGGTVVVLPKANPEAVVDTIEQYGVTDLFLPPTVIYRLLEVLQDSPRELSSLRYVIYGAAPMSVEKLRQALTAIGPVMMELYGQMEAPASVTFLRPDEHFVDGAIAPDSRLSSCGRPYPLVEVEVRDDDGMALPPGTAGEICVRGDLVMKGYYKNPEQTRLAIREGWLHTGDIGLFDDEGYLHLTDRRRDLIISGGFNVYPSEVEQVIWGHPAVRDCAVVGSPHPDWGEAVTAVVELNENCSVTEQELIALCKQELGSIRAPKSVHLVPSLPRSVNGKVLKKNIREAFWRDEKTKI